MKHEILFRTPIVLKKPHFSISHVDRLMFIGSCFTENIGFRAESLKFPTDINPFGILYNPLSILKSLERLLNRRKFSTDDLFFRNGIWNSFSHHSRFSDIDRAKTLEKINSRFEISADFLNSADFLLLTFGTSLVYEIIETGEIAANCHKMPAAFFREKNIDTELIVNQFSEFLEKLKIRKPSLKIILTVSPVRHLKNGIIENSRSKAVLITAVHRLCELFENTTYFPAYEIMNDDLRDYRFYESDMIHPNRTAVDYIFGHFSNTFFSEKTKKVNEEIIKIQKSIQHKPFNSETKEYHNFLQKALSNISTLTNQNPELDFTEEIENLMLKGE